MYIKLSKFFIKDIFNNKFNINNKIYKQLIIIY